MNVSHWQQRDQIAHGEQVKNYLDAYTEYTRQIKARDAMRIKLNRTGKEKLKEKLKDKEKEIRARRRKLCLCNCKLHRLIIKATKRAHHPPYVYTQTQLP